jgi:hypothetical protein
VRRNGRWTGADALPAAVQEGARLRVDFEDGGSWTGTVERMFASGTHARLSGDAGLQTYESGIWWMQFAGWRRVKSAKVASITRVNGRRRMAARRRHNPAHEGARALIARGRTDWHTTAPWSADLARATLTGKPRRR